MQLNVEISATISECGENVMKMEYHYVSILNVIYSFFLFIYLFIYLFLFIYFFFFSFLTLCTDIWTFCSAISPDKGSIEKKTTANK